MLISNLQVYQEGMKKSLLDKLFFLDKIESNSIVDFGCANGELIKFMNMLFPEYTYIGYDISEEMINSAKTNIELTGNIYLTSDWNEVKSLLKGSVTILLSSVIHEIYSYSNLIENNKFWNEIVFGGLFDYVVIRDMMPKRSINRKSEINDIKKVRQKADKYHLLDFENNWGSIEENKNLIHFLFKYRYVENWSREVLENYFPLYTEKFLELIPDNYTIDYYEEFVLPFTKRKIESDFGIILKDTTHVKFIIRKTY